MSTKVYNCETRECDVCGKKVTETGLRFGGSVFSGWMNLVITDGSTMLARLLRKKNFDVCGTECLKKLIEMNYRVPEKKAPFN
jgi:hypothetical protein